MDSKSWYNTWVLSGEFEKDIDRYFIEADVSANADSRRKYFEVALSNISDTDNLYGVYKSFHQDMEFTLNLWFALYQATKDISNTEYKLDEISRVAHMLKDKWVFRDMQSQNWDYMITDEMHWKITHRDFLGERYEPSLRMFSTNRWLQACMGPLGFSDCFSNEIEACLAITADINDMSAIEANIISSLRKTNIIVKPTDAYGVYTPFRDNYGALSDLYRNDMSLLNGFRDEPLLISRNNSKYVSPQYKVSVRYYTYLILDTDKNMRDYGDVKEVKSPSDVGNYLFERLSKNKNEIAIIKPKYYLDPTFWGKGPKDAQNYFIKLGKELKLDGRWDQIL